MGSSRKDRQRQWSNFEAIRIDTFMKDKLVSLVTICVVGLAACFASYKYGPIPIKKQPPKEAPPGWVPPVK